MPSQLVTFQTVPANVTSRTKRGSGEFLSYSMVTGIKVGSQSVTFRHPDYDVQVDSGAKTTDRQIMMPALMAARLIPYARATFMRSDHKYDGSGFTAYISGYQATPAHRSHGSLRLVTARASVVEEMAYHVIGAETGEILQSFIGLRKQHALCVLGLHGTFGILPAKDLMRVYGAVALGRVTGPA